VMTENCQSNEDASIRVSNAKTGVIVFAYEAHKDSRKRSKSLRWEVHATQQVLEMLVGAKVVEPSFGLQQ
jgi:hypothetical protein